MNHPQQLLALDTPLQPVAAVPVRVREMRREPAALAVARELWAAVQLGVQPNCAPAAAGAIPGSSWASCCDPPAASRH